MGFKGDRRDNCVPGPFLSHWFRRQVQLRYRYVACAAVLLFAAQAGTIVVAAAVSEEMELVQAPPKWTFRPVPDDTIRAEVEKLAGACSPAAKAWKKVERLMERYDRAERAWKRIEATLELFRPDGSLNDRAWATEEIAAAVKELDAAEWGKLRRALADRRSLMFLDRMHRQLATAEPRAELREALLRRWWLRRQSATVAEDAPGGGRWLAAALVQTEYCRKLAANWEESYRRMAAVLRHTVRASSAVECMNSVLRMHQGRHRTVTQPMLDRKRLYWNCRAFKSGKRQRRCPYELLGLRLPTTDWWQLLHAPLGYLTQQLSSSQVTI